MFAIDFTKPYLYKDVVYFHQGNLSTNNTLRCTLNTGGSNDLTGCNIICTFKLQNSTEISGAGRIIDPLNAIVDLVFPSNALAVGLNKLEILVNRSDGSVAQSPSITYDIWQGLTTGNGIEAETNYPILIELINSTNGASNKANSALNKANSMITDITDAIDNAYRSANDADIAASNANTKIEEVETAKTEMIKKVDTSIVTMKSDVEVAKNEMASKADEKIADVDRALAAGTVDLELKEARKDASGVVHDTVKQRLDSDLIVGDKSLKDFVIDMNGMKESQDLSYDTDTGYKVCQNTKNGVVKDFKLYGKTVVNVLPKLSKLGFGMGGVGAVITNNINGVFSGISSNDNYYVYDGENIAKVLYPNSQYTAKGFIEITCTIAGTINVFYISLVDGVNKTRVVKSYKLSIGKNYIPINDVFITDSLCNGTCGFYTNNVGTISDLKFMFMILRGDVSKLNMNSHIEGVVSVGNCNEIEVSTVNDGNLFDGEFIKGTVSGADGVLIPNNSGYMITPKDIIKVSPGINVIYKSTGLRGFRPGKNVSYYFYDKSDNLISRGSLNTFDTIEIPCNCYGLRITLADFELNTSFDASNYNMTLNQIGTLENSNFAKQDKKTILFKDIDNQWKLVTELRGIDLTVCDTIEKHSDGKYYMHIRTEKSVVSSSDGFTFSKPNGFINTVQFWNYGHSKLPNVIKGSRNCICDKLNQLSTTEKDEEFFIVGTSAFVIGLNINKANSLETLDAYLKINPITFIYPIEEKIYEVNPIEVDSFDSDTLATIKGGPLPIKASFKVTSSLPNFVKELSNQIKQLQDQVYKTNVANFTVALNTLDTKLRLDRLEAPVI